MQKTLTISAQDYDVPSFADDEETFAAANQYFGLEGDKISIDKIVDTPVKFLAYNIRESRYQRYGTEVVMVQIEVDGVKRIFFTQSTRIRRTLELFKDKLPRIGTIKREGRAWRIA